MMPNRIKRPEARVLAEEEFVSFAALVKSLTPEEWASPTDCTAWDVRKMALHVLGLGDAEASVREFAHQFQRGMRLNKEIDSHHWVDGLNELQIREREHLSNSELSQNSRPWAQRQLTAGATTSDAVLAAPVRSAHRVGPAQVPARRRLHPRRVGPSHRHPRGHRPADAPHRRSRRTPRRRHRRRMGERPRPAVRTGARRSRWREVQPGVDGERVEIDAVDFIRTLSGRLPGAGVLSHPLPL